MRVAVIGLFSSNGGSSYPHRIAGVINHTHTSYCFPTQDLRFYDPDGMRTIYPISVLLGDKTEEIDSIIVVQSRIMIHNDTDKPLLLFKTESVEPYYTVDNPTYVMKKLERMEDYDDYDYTIASAIALHLYNPDREKDILIADIPWLPLPFKDYVERLERAQHLIIMQRYHEIDCYTARTIEAMACKTIPIIFYNDPRTKELYESIGITKDVAYFVSTSKYTNLQIKEYDIEMAQRGYELVRERFNMKVHTNTFMEILANG